MGVEKKPLFPTEQACEAIWLSPRSDGKVPLKEEATILMLTGNPGVPHYYKHFAQALADGMSCKVVVLGYLGHTLEPKGPAWKVFSLEEQLEHTLGFIDSLPLGGEKLRIVGHSIGGYVAIEALRKRPQIVSHVLGMQPFLENNNGSRSFGYMKLLAGLPSPVFFPILGTICSLLMLVQYLPLTVRKLLLLVTGQTSGFDPEWVDFTADAMMQPGVFANYAYMGRTEVKHHAREWDFAAQLGPGAVGLSEGLAQRVRLLYTDGDMWAPQELAKRAEAAGVAAEVRTGLPHAFSTKKESCDWVADWAVRQLRELRASGPTN